MKKLMILFLLFTLTNFCFGAKVEFGTDIGFSFNSDINKVEYNDSDAGDEKEKWSGNSVVINPRISILTDKVEFAPSVYFGLANSKYVEEEGDSTINTDRTMNLRYGIGFGAYFKLVRSEHVRLSIGPGVSFINNSKTIDLESSDDTNYKSYSNFDLSLGFPLNLDILAGDKFGLRLSSRVIAFDWDHYAYQINYDWGDGPKRSNNEFNIDVTALFSPSFGFFIRF